MGATGFAYASFGLEDREGSVSLADVPAFREFLAGIAGRCEEQPIAQQATVVGAHRMLRPALS